MKLRTLLGRQFVLEALRAVFVEGEWHASKGWATHKMDCREIWFLGTKPRLAYRRQCPYLQQADEWLDSKVNMISIYPSLTWAWGQYKLSYGLDGLLDVTQVAHLLFQLLKNCHRWCHGWLGRSGLQAYKCECWWYKKTGDTRFYTR